MSLTINLYYTGKRGAVRKFMNEMESSGLADQIRQEVGNERYDYYFPVKDPETVLLIDTWTNQKAIDQHHHSPMMKKLAQLRDKYDLHMEVERYVSAAMPKSDQQYLRK